MSSRSIDIRFGTKYDGSGAAAAKTDIGSLTRVISVFSRGTTGPLKKVLALIRDIATGGIWQIGASAIMAAGSLVVKFFQREKEAAEAAAKAAKESADAIKSTVSEISSTMSTGISSVDKYTSSLIKQLDATKQLAVAEKELEKQRAIASGDTAAAAKADEEIAVITAKSEQDKEAARVEGYKRRRQIAVDAERKLDKQLDQATKAVEEVDAKRQAMLGDPGRRGDRSVSYKPGDEESAWGRANREAVGWASLHNGQRLSYLQQNRADEWEAKVKDYRDRVFREERKKLYASDEWKKTNEDQKAAQEVSLKAADELFKARQKIADIDAEEKRRVTENAAKKKEAEAKAIADNTAAEKKAIADAAAERERLDREAHQKRMADLRAEIAASKEAASPFEAVAAAAKTEFERAFAMYRDPERAKAEIDEERDRSDDLKRLHKDATRYGGKWRIDELSQLMAAGDSAGVQARLEDWRKSKSFSPEVEAMVRASAAEKTQTTAEDELRKIEGNTRNLSEKLDQLLTMKGN